VGSAGYSWNRWKNDHIREVALIWKVVGPSVALSVELD